MIEKIEYRTNDEEVKAVLFVFISILIMISLSRFSNIATILFSVFSRKDDFGKSLQIFVPRQNVNQGSS
jgi:hypothetical protein